MIRKKIPHALVNFCTIYSLAHLYCREVERDMRIYSMHLFFCRLHGIRTKSRGDMCMQYSMLLHRLCYRKGTSWKSTRELSWLGCFRPREPLLGGDSSNHSWPLGNPRRRRTALPMPIHIYTDESQQSFSKNMCFYKE